MFFHEARFEHALRQRTPLDDAQFCERCDGKGAVTIAGKIRSECEKQLNLPAQRLYPEDNLIDVYDDLDIVEIVEACTEVVGCDPKRIDYAEIDGSVGSIVRVITMAMKAG